MALQVSRGLTNKFLGQYHKIYSTQTYSKVEGGLTFGVLEVKLKIYIYWGVKMIIKIIFLKILRKIWTKSLKYCRAKEQNK